MMTCRDLRVGVVPEAREDYIEFFWMSMEDLPESNLEPHPLRNLIPGWVLNPALGTRWAGTM